MARSSYNIDVPNKYPVKRKTVECNQTPCPLHILLPVFDNSNSTVQVANAEVRNHRIWFLESQNIYLREKPLKYNG